MSESGASAPLSSLRTVWTRSPDTPLRQFLRTETGSAAVLLTATIAALVWANADTSGYDAAWRTELSIQLGSRGLSDSVHGWVNSGLMAFFFLVAGLEARREFDMGELRERRRLVVPLVVGLGGMVVPIAIYLAINAGRPSVSGWGTAMSTDTAFALGALALVGSGVPDRVRTYLLTFAIVDDVAGIVIIALAYSGHIDLAALGIGIAILAVVIVTHEAGIRHGLVYLVLGVAGWIAFFESGVDPVVVGLVMGMLALAYPAARGDLEQAWVSFRLFREQPTPELASAARESVRSAISPNDRLQQLFHPWTSYLIVPLFALANAGIPVSGSFLAHAFTTPVTLGILAGYVVGKPIGTVGAAWLLTRVSRGRIRPPVGWASLTGAGCIAGIGFIVCLLIASLAFHGAQLAEAKVGVLSGVVCASVLTWVVFQLAARLLAAEGAEAAAKQGNFWDMHDQLLDHQGALTAKDLIGYARQIGLDTGRFTRDLRNLAGEAKIMADMDSADLSGVSGTPTFFVNGRRHHGAYDLGTLTGAVQAARARVLISSAGQSRRR